MNTTLLRQLRPATVVRETDAFRATRLRDGRVRIACKMEGYKPQCLRISWDLFQEINERDDNGFDFGCLFDVGVGLHGGKP